MKNFVEYIIPCSGLKVKTESPYYRELEYRQGEAKNVNIYLSKFVKSVDRLKGRYKDLLEIAGYIFAADRYCSRGSNLANELHRWSREFDFHFKVRDLEFWRKEEIQKLLNDALKFMTGDHNYKFTFYKAEPDFPTSLFDNEDFIPDHPENCKIVLFSGGIDSLAGVIELINETDSEIWLASHQSGSTKIKRTQRKLFEAIEEKYPGRCKHYKYQCGLSVDTSNDESQRTRPLLYMATAFTLARAYKQNEITVYENGITSINLPETQDLMNGRASRTTHPKTIVLLEKLFRKIADEPFHIHHPYLLKTKTEVVEFLKKYDALDLLNSSVSCSGTRKNMSDFTHCGECGQCIDRRFAVYAAEVEKYDEAGIYRFNFLKDDLLEKEVIRNLNEYIRMGKRFKEQDIDSFYNWRGLEILEAITNMKGESEEKNLNDLFNMSRLHSKQIDFAVTRMRRIHDSIYEPPKSSNSFFNLILGEREYLAQNEEKEEMHKLKVPSRALKRTVLRFANEMFEQGKLTEEMVETKAEKQITTILIPLLEKKYELTSENKRSIHLYFRRGDLMLRKNKGKLCYIDSYPGKK